MTGRQASASLSWSAGLAPEEIERVQAEVQRHAGAPATPFDVTWRVALPQSGTRWIRNMGKIVGHDAQGQPAWVTRTLSVKIPPGVHPGQFIRLAKQGLPGLGGEAPGDLYLEVRIAPHKLYRIEGRDLYLTLPVTPSEAALGAQVQVPTPGGGVVEVTVPPGARGGMKLRLKERGFPGQSPGHLYLLLEIALPPADSEAARAAYRQLAQAAPFDPRRHLGVSA